MKGIAKGLAGVVLKPGAAIWALPGYTFMGINKEIKKMFGSSVLNYIISARTVQGYEEAKNASPQERMDIITRWREHKDEYQSSKQRLEETRSPEGQESGRLTPRGFMQTRHLSFDERKKLHEERKKRREEERRKLEAAQPAHGRHKFCPFCRRTEPHSHEPRALQHTPIINHHDGEHDNFEEAIHASVAATSRGNPEEDAMIERAIRASVRELQSSSSSTLSDEEALNRAIQASIASAGRGPSDEQDHGVAMTDEEAAHQAALEKAIQASLAQYQLTVAPDPVVDDVDTDEDENVKLAILMSKEEPAQLDDEEHGIKLALQKSKEDALLSKTKTEEEIVLEYVKKQSLIEEQHRRNVAGKRREEPATPAETLDSASTADTQVASTPATTLDTASIMSDDEQMSKADEEALRLAIEESMRGSA